MWKETSKSLPKLEQEVLLYPDFAGHCTVGQLVEDEKMPTRIYFEDLDGRELRKVTHYMEFKYPEKTCD